MKVLRWTWDISSILYNLETYAFVFNTNIYMYAMYISDLIQYTLQRKPIDITRNTAKFVVMYSKIHGLWWIRLIIIIRFFGVPFLSGAFFLECRSIYSFISFSFFCCFLKYITPYKEKKIRTKHRKWRNERIASNKKKRRKKHSKQLWNEKPVDRHLCINSYTRWILYMILRLLSSDTLRKKEK